MITRFGRFSVIRVGVLLAIGAGLYAYTMRHGSAANDRAALAALERRWLAAEHDSAALAEILAPDFVHVVSTGDFLTRAQHIHYATAYPTPAGERRAFDTLLVRVFGNVGIATGVVRASESSGAVNRTAFTDVFARRNGRWLAVNAQENPIEARQAPP
ncbi:MAG: nuclear transport factor 2 family protein [Gemmatimonadaceae bacterium]